MKLAVIYGMKNVVGRLADNLSSDGALSRNEPGSKLKQRVDNFQAALRDSYHSLSEEQQEKVDNRIEEVKDFVRDTIKRRAREQTTESLSDAETQLTQYLKSAALTLQTLSVSGCSPARPEKSQPQGDQPASDSLMTEDIQLT